MPSETVKWESGAPSEGNEGIPAGWSADGRGLPVIGVLERLAKGASLSEIMAATGLNDSELRACFGVAAKRVQQSFQKAGKENPLDWRQVTLPEALAIIADHAARTKL